MINNDLSTLYMTYRRPQQTLFHRDAFSPNSVSHWGVVRLGYALWTLRFVCAGIPFWDSMLISTAQARTELASKKSQFQRHRFTGCSCTFSDMNFILHGRCKESVACGGVDVAICILCNHRLKFATEHLITFAYMSMTHESGFINFVILFDST